MAMTRRALGALLALRDQAFVSRVTADGTTLIGLGAAQFREFLRNDLQRGREVVRVSGARIE